MSSWHKSAPAVQEIENSEERNAYILMDRIQVRLGQKKDLGAKKVEIKQIQTGSRFKKVVWK